MRRRNRFLLRFRFLGTVFLAVWLLGATASAEPASERPSGGRPVLVFSTFESRGMGRLFKRILEEAYARIGYATRFVEVPGERALVMANQGSVDGEAGRVAVIESRCPNLVRVPTSLYANRVVAYTRRGGVVPPAATWEGLSRCRLGMVLGYKYVQAKTASMNRVIVSDYDKLFNMLLHDRVDVALVEYLDAQPALRALDRKRLRLMLPPIDSRPMYHYLHRRRAALVPLIDKALREMRDEGRMEALQREMAASFDAADEREGSTPSENAGLRPPSARPATD